MMVTTLALGLFTPNNALLTDLDKYTIITIAEP